MVKQAGKSAVELRHALAHGAFTGGMRYAQGGKFEHGFMSGFVSSLGGSATNNTTMSVGARVTISAVTGGTAEKLGGGKFANGAVTGAYVMMFNHLMHSGKDNNPQESGNKERLSLKDKDLPQKLIDEMKVINKTGFQGSSVYELFDEESLSFGKNERYKVEVKEFDGSYVTITVVNPKFGPDFGSYYQVLYRPFQSFGRVSSGWIDIGGQKSVVSMRINNSVLYYKIYDEIRND